MPSASSAARLSFIRIWLVRLFQSCVSPADQPNRSGLPGSEARDPLRETFVQRHQLAPRALGFHLVVERRAILDRHVRYAPAVSGRIDFDLRRNARLRKALAQLVLRL